MTTDPDAPTRQRPVVRRHRAGRPGGRRREELLAGRDDLQPGPGRGVACPTASPPPRRRTGGSWRAGLADVIDDRVGRAGHRRRLGAGECRARDPAGGGGAAVPGGPGGRHPGRVRASWPARTRMPPSRCDPAPPPRICPTPRSPGSRRRSSTSAASTRSCRPSGRCSPRSTTTGPSPTGCTTPSSTTRSPLSAGVQQMVRSDVGASGVMFTMDTESRFPGRGLRHVRLRAGRGRRAGRGEPRRVLRLQAGAAGRATGDPEAGHRRQGDQDGLHRGPRRSAGPRSSSTCPRRTVGVLSLTDAEVTELARQARRHRGALRPADGHRVGQGRRRRASSTSCRPGRRR